MVTTLTRTQTLRPYQSRAVEELRQAIRSKGSAVYVLPTGGGKTVIFGEIARLAAEKGSRTLFLVHRRELIKQAVDTLEKFLPGMSFGVEAAGWPSMPWSNVQIASVQSLVRRDVDLKPDLIVVDEAHHCRATTWATILGKYPTVPRLGLTATPERLDGRGLGEHFNVMVKGPTISELVEDGYLAPCRTLTIPTSIDLDGLKANRRGEYGAAIANRITDEVVADMAALYVRYAPGRQAVFFGENRDHSRRVVAKLQEMGVNAEHVDGDDHPARRDRVMGEFKDRRIQVVGNCDLISEGFDAPSCDAVILGKKTGSVTSYLQKAGRAMRPGLDKEALIIDPTGISYELGLSDETREWSLEDGEVNERKGGERNPRECSQCHTMFYGSRCPYCQFQPPMAEVQEEKVDLVEAQGRVNGKKNRRSDLWRDLAIAKKQNNVKQAVEEIARKRGYKPGWAGHILRAWGI